MEMMTEEAARTVTEKISIPTIGIGSGRFCDGQVLVLHDLIGLYKTFTPKFAKRYADVGGLIRESLDGYAKEVREGKFPSEENVFRMIEGQKPRSDSLQKT